MINGEEKARVKATDTLAELLDPRAVPALERSLYQSEQVRLAAANALIQFGPDLAFAPLMAALTSSENNVRAIAAESLGKLADPRTEGPLLQALLDPSPDVRRHAAIALTTACTPAFHPAAEAIRTIVTGPPDARGAAVQQLVADGDQRIKDLLTWMLNHEEDAHLRTDIARALPTFGVDATDLLIQNLITPHAEKASQVLVALDRDAVDPLATAVKTGSDRIREAAIHVLGQIEDGRIEPILVAVLADAESSMAVKTAALSALGDIVDKPHLIPTVAQLLKDDNHRVKKDAAYKLGRSQNQLAIVPLMAALDDWAIRLQAKDALAQLGDLACDALLKQYETEKNKEIRLILGDLLGDKKPRKMGKLFGRRHN